MKFNVHIKGIAPLLFNRFPEDTADKDKVKQKRAEKSKEDEMELSLYRNEKGQICSLADHIVGSMVKASTNFKLEGKKTFKDVVKAGVFVEPIMIPHINQKYTLDYRSVVNPNTRGRMMKARGRLDQWELKFILTCIDDRARDQDVKSILEYAGGYCGIGDYRPRYGRFEVKSWKKV